MVTPPGKGGQSGKHQSSGSGSSGGRRHKSTLHTPTTTMPPPTEIPATKSQEKKKRKEKEKQEKERKEQQEKERKEQKEKERKEQEEKEENDEDELSKMIEKEGDKESEDQNAGFTEEDLLKENDDEDEQMESQEKSNSAGGAQERDKGVGDTQKMDESAGEAQEQNKQDETEEGEIMDQSENQQQSTSENVTGGTGEKDKEKPSYTASGNSTEGGDADDEKSERDDDGGGSSPPHSTVNTETKEPVTLQKIYDEATTAILQAPVRVKNEKGENVTVENPELWGGQKTRTVPDLDVYAESTDVLYEVDKVASEMLCSRDYYRKELLENETVQRLCGIKRSELTDVKFVPLDDSDNVLDPARPFVTGLHGTAMKAQLVAIPPEGAEADYMRREPEVAMILPKSVPIRGYKWGDSELDRKRAQLPYNGKTITDLYNNTELVTADEYSRGVARKMLTVLRGVSKRAQSTRQGEEVPLRVTESHMAAIVLGQEATPVHVVPQQEGLNKFTRTYRRTPGTNRTVFLDVRPETVPEAVEFLEEALMEDGVLGVTITPCRLPLKTRVNIQKVHHKEDKLNEAYTACANELLYVPYALAIEQTMYTSSYVSVITFATLKGDVVHFAASAFIKEDTVCELHPALKRLMTKQDGPEFKNRHSMLLYWDMPDTERQFKASFGVDLGVYNYDVQMAVRESRGDNPKMGEGPNLPTFFMMMTGQDISDPLANANQKAKVPNEKLMATVAATVEAPPGVSPHYPLLSDKLNPMNNDFVPRKLMDWTVVENVAKLAELATRAQAIVDSFVVGTMIYAPLQSARDETMMIRPVVQQLLLRTDMDGYYTHTTDLQAVYENKCKDDKFRNLVEALEIEQAQSGTHAPLILGLSYMELATVYTVNKVNSIKQECEGDPQKKGTINRQLITNMLINASNDVFENIWLMMIRESAIAKQTLTLAELQHVSFMAEQYYLSARTQLTYWELPQQLSVIMRLQMADIKGGHPLAALLILEYQMMAMVHSPLALKPPMLTAVLQGQAYVNTYCSPKPMGPYAIKLLDRDAWNVPELNDSSTYEHELMIRAFNSTTNVEQLKREMIYGIWAYAGGEDLIYADEYRSEETPPPYNLFMLEYFNEDYLNVEAIPESQLDLVKEAYNQEYKNSGAWKALWEVWHRMAKRFTQRNSNTNRELCEKQAKARLTNWETWFSLEALDSEYDFAKHGGLTETLSFWDKMVFLWDETVSTHPRMDLVQMDARIKPVMGWHTTGTRQLMYPHFRNREPTPYAMSKLVDVQSERKTCVELMTYEDEKNTVWFHNLFKREHINWNTLLHSVFNYMQNNMAEFKGLRLPPIGLPRMTSEEEFAGTNPLYVNTTYYRAGTEAKDQALVSTKEFLEQQTKIKHLQERLETMEREKREAQEADELEAQLVEDREETTVSFQKRVEGRTDLVTPLGADTAVKIRAGDLPGVYFDPFVTFQEFHKELTNKVANVTEEGSQTASMWYHMKAIASPGVHIIQPALMAVGMRENQIQRKLAGLADVTFLNEKTKANASTTTLDFYKDPDETKVAQKGTEDINPRAEPGKAVEYWNQRSGEPTGCSQDLANLPTYLEGRMMAGKLVGDVYSNAKEVGKAMKDLTETERMLDGLNLEESQPQPPYAMDEEESHEGSVEPDEPGALTRYRKERYQLQRADYQKHNLYWQRPAEDKGDYESSFAEDALKVALNLDNRGASGQAYRGQYTPRGGRGTSTLCYNCNELGHISRNCPLPAVPRGAYSDRGSRGRGLRQSPSGSGGSGGAAVPPIQDEDDARIQERLVASASEGNRMPVGDRGGRSRGGFGARGRSRGGYGYGGVYYAAGTSADDPWFAYGGRREQNWPRPDVQPAQNHQQEGGFVRQAGAGRGGFGSSQESIELQQSQSEEQLAAR